MKNYFIGLLFFCLIISCNNPNKKNTLSGKDLINKDTVSTKMSENDINYVDMLKEYIAAYPDKIKIDTSTNDEISFKLVHYCLYDNGLNIPEKYNWGTKKDVFITHNFASQIYITSVMSIIV